MYTTFLTLISNCAIIGPVDYVSNKNRQTNGNGGPIFRTLGVMKPLENVKLSIRRMDPITILP